MYNSEEVYTFEQNNNNQFNPSHPSSIEEKNIRSNNSRPKNQIILGPKVNAISGTYGRMVPKRPIQDMERLYGQNMQLRQKIKVLEDDCIKIKTRLLMTERQKQQLLTQLCNLDYGNPALRERRLSQKGLHKGQQKASKPLLEQNRKILHSYKDEIAKLKLENGRLKKTVKYTQIQQLETQNKLLQQQVIRIKAYAKDIIDNTQYDEYERQIQLLNKSLQQQKDSKKSFHSQLKKKDEEIEEIRNKMKIIASRKAELQKKYSRQINLVKGELHRAKQKEREYLVSAQERRQTQQRREASRAKLIEKQAQCKNCQRTKEINDTDKSKLKQYQGMLAAKDKQISDLQLKLKQSDKKKEQLAAQARGQEAITNIKEQKQKQKFESKTIVVHSVEAPPIVEKEGDQEKPNIKDLVAKQKTQLSQQESYQQYDAKDLQLDSSNKKEQNMHFEQSQDKFDAFHLQLQSQKKNQMNKGSNKKQNSKKEQKKSKKRESQVNESDEEVLFQKDKQQDSRAKQKPKEKKPESKKKIKQQKQESGIGSSKANKILKDTLKHRLIAQRYTYNDFQRDIKDSDAKQFTVDQIVQMLSYEPFFFEEEHLKMVIFHIFEKLELAEQDTVTTASFLKKMKVLIGQFELKQEQQEQQILSEIKKKLKKKKNILSKLKQEALGQEWISKKGFVRVMKEVAGLNEDQIQQSLAEASVISPDIAHINYKQFVQKLGQS